MVELEAGGDMKNWMRATVVWGDLLVWVSAVVVYCRSNYARGTDEKGWRPVVSLSLSRFRCLLTDRYSFGAQIVSSMSILLQPALLLIDNGHFQCVSSRETGQCRPSGLLAEVLILLSPSQVQLAHAWLNFMVDQLPSSWS
jgi:hypothetical protein